MNHSGDLALRHKIKITKLDAARRQLKSAISLWFNEGDPVSVHTLAAASYDIIHTLARRKGAAHLIFDSPIIVEKYRKQWVQHIKQWSAFFKHADRDPDGEIEFVPAINEFFFLFTCVAITQMGETLAIEEQAFLHWLSIYRPQFVKKESKSLVPVHIIEDIQRLPKHDFFEQFKIAWRLKYPNA